MTSPEIPFAVSKKKLLGGLGAAVLRHSAPKGTWHSVTFFHNEYKEFGSTPASYQLADLDSLQELIDWARDEIARIEAATYKTTRPTKI